MRILKLFDNVENRGAKASHGVWAVARNVVQKYRRHDEARSETCAPCHLPIGNSHLPV